MLLRKATVPRNDIRFAIARVGMHKTWKVAPDKASHLGHLVDSFQRRAGFRSQMDVSIMMAWSPKPSAIDLSVSKSEEA